MSPWAGFVLMEEIAPRLRNFIPCAVRPIGAEDAEELVQDAIAVAAAMLHRLELRGKEVTPGNVCHYVALLIEDVLRAPAWRASVVACHQRTTCRAARRDGLRAS